MWSKISSYYAQSLIIVTLLRLPVAVFASEVTQENAALSPKSRDRVSSSDANALSPEQKAIRQLKLEAMKQINLQSKMTRSGSRQHEYIDGFSFAAS